MNRRETGAIGERLAAEYLVQHGFKLVETNYRCREGEIDIIAEKSNCLVFIEVRTKRSSQFGSPEESINRTKQTHLRNIAARYYESHPGLPENYRIDVIAIELDRGDKARRISHMENAVEDEE